LVCLFGLFRLLVGLFLGDALSAIFLGEDAVVKGMVVGAEVAEFDLVAFEDGVGEVFKLEVELGGRDFLAVELTRNLVDLGAGVGELFLAVGDRFGEFGAGGL